MKNKKHDFKIRLYSWTLKLIQVVDALPHSISNNAIAQQVIRSGTSVCANYVEGQAASSRKDFTNFLSIALKSANETKYWLAILRDLKRIDTKKASSLLTEIEEIANILGASIKTLKSKK